MSQSFEKKVGSRLQHYEPSPPANLKSKVFNVVNPNRGLNGWQVTGAILFFLSFFFWMQGALPGSQLVSENTEPFKIVATNQGEEQTIDKKDRRPYFVQSEERQKESVDTPKKMGSKSLPSTPLSEKDEAVDAKPTSKDFGGASAAYFGRDDLLTWDVEGRQVAFGRAAFGDLALSLSRRESMSFSKEVVPPKKSLPIYLESGLFFLYQQAFPNVEDELVITDFEGTSGFSPSRLGANLELGVHFSPLKSMRLHLGAKLNTFQQTYRFGIRSFAADSVEITQIGDEVVFNPIFDQDKIAIDHRLYGAGLRASLNWNIFPSYTNELVAAIEYLTILNGQKEFQYDGRAYGVGYSDQFLLSVGMRKTLFENQKGMLQIHPSIRYSLNQVSPAKREVLSMKPYSVGVSVSYIFGNFRFGYKELSQ